MKPHIPPHGSISSGTGSTDTGAAVGAMSFVDARTLPENAVNARTQQELHTKQHGGTLGGANFSNPKSNVHKLGFKEGMAVADFGAGSGAYTLALASMVGSTGTVYAVDVQRDLLTRIQNEAQRRGFENVQPVWGDIESQDSVSIRDGLLDGVLLSNTLFQLDDKITAIKEAWRVLKPGGVLAIIDWSESFGGLGPQQDAVVSRNEAKLTCIDNQFMFKQEFPAGEHHYGLLFIKTGGNEAHGTNNTQDTFISKTIEQELL